MTKVSHINEAIKMAFRNQVEWKAKFHIELNTEFQKSASILSASSEFLTQTAIESATGLIITQSWWTTAGRII